MAFRSQNTNVTIVSGTTSVGTMPASVAIGDRVYAFIGSGAANPNTLTAPSGWTKEDEYAPSGFLKTALFYVDITSGNIGTFGAGSTHTWTFAVAGRNWAVLVAYSGADLTRAPAFTVASGIASSAGPHTVPALTVPDNDWEVIFCGARESPGTDNPKTWTLSGGPGTDVERLDAYGNNTGTGNKLTVAVYDTNGAASVGGGGSTVTLHDAPPVNTFNALCLTSPLRIGATLDRTTITYWEPKLLQNEWMRIFPDPTTKMPPDWEDSRYQYCHRVGAHPFISSKIDGNTTKINDLYDYLMAMPPWIKDDPNVTLWYIEHHEAEKDYTDRYGSKASGASHYIADFTAVWNKVQTLPSNIRSKIKMGPAATKQWTDSSAPSKGNFDYTTFDPGVGDFFGYDCYADSSQGNPPTAITSFPNPVTFLQYIKAHNTGSRPKLFPELGVIGAPFDTDGTARAAWLQGIHDEVVTWSNFQGFIWWNDHGTPSTTSVAGIGTERYFELNLRHTGTDGSNTEIPSVTTTVSVGGGGGTGSARTVTVTQPVEKTHIWAATVPMPAPAPPAATNPWSQMGLPQR